MLTINEGASIQSLADTILRENRSVLASLQDRDLHALVQALLGARQIVLYGAGRMGILASAFAMRLTQLGLCSHMLTAPTTPSVGTEDLLLLCSGSGETQTVYEVAALGKHHGVRLALITARPESRIGQLADVLVRYTVPTKLEASSFDSIQPLTTVAEQSLLLLLDIVVLLLMRATHQTSEDLWRRHRNLE